MAKKKTTTQLDREIAQSLMFAGAATPHSAKALTTLARMGTTPTQWQLTGGLHCNLCNKLVMKSRRVPVHATGDDGVTHGMFVGEDCARKFLDVQLKREDDAIMETGNAPL